MLIRSLPAVFAIGLVTFALSGCSPAAKKARLLEKADHSFAEGKYDEAEIDYKNVLQIEGLNPRAICQLGIIYAEEGRTGRAIPFILKGHELLPENLDLRLKLGQLNLATGKVKEAQKEANYILDRRPQDPEAPLLLTAAMTNPADAAAAQARLQSLPAPAPSGAPVLAALGMVEFRLQHIKEAEALYQRAMTANPKFASAYAALGLLRLSQNDAAGADAALKEAANLSPDRSLRRLQYAQFKIRTGDQTGARALLEEMTQRTPDYLPAWIALAQIAANEKKFAESGQLVGKALTRDPDNLEARLFQGQLHLAMSDGPKAIAEFEKLTADFPRLPIAHLELGRAYAGAGDNSKAIDSLNQAVSLLPGYVEAIIPLATLSIRKGDLSNAIVLLRKLIQQRPELPLPRLLLADAYRGQGNLDDALAIYDEVENHAPQNLQTPLLRGQVLLQQKKFGEARAAFGRAAELAPDNIVPLEQLVNLDLLEKNPATAHQRVETYISTHPKDGGAYVLKARIFVAQKDQTQAENALKQAIELHPEIPAPYYMLASLYFAANLHQKALTNLAELIARNPKDRQALMLTGVLHDELKDFRAARVSYEKLLAIDSKFTAALNNLAYLYSEHFNEPDKAQELAQRARDLLPQEPHTADTLGWILYKKRQFPRALVLLYESAGKLPESAEVQYHLGMTYYMTGNEDAAHTFLLRALGLSNLFNGSEEARKRVDLLELDPRSGVRAALEKIVAERADDPVALARLAFVYERDGNIDKAISTNQAALRASPGYVRVMLGLVRLYSARKETPKALELAKAARKAAPLDPNAAHALGLLAFQTGDFGWAVSLLQEAARRQPDVPETQFDFALAAYSVGRVDDAQAALHSSLEGNPNGPWVSQARHILDLIGLAVSPTQAGALKVDQALETDPNDVPALMALAAIHESKANVNGAKQAYERALKYYPDFTPAKMGLAILYAKVPGDEQRAFELATQARDAFPDDPALAKAFGMIVYRRGDFARAADLLTESAVKYPEDPELLYYLGMSQTHLKNPLYGIKTLQRALDLGLRTDLASEAKKTISGVR